VDDSELNRKMLGQMLGSRFDIAEAASGEACLQLLEQNATGISIVLLDIHMPGIDGFTVLEEMNQKNLLEQIPVIMISSEDTVDAVRRAFDLGASDYISRPFDAKVVYQRIINTIQLYAKQRRLSAMAADLAFEKERASRMMIGILSQVVEKRNGESRDHVQRVAQLTSMPAHTGDAPHHCHGGGPARHWQNGDLRGLAAQGRPTDRGRAPYPAKPHPAGSTDAGRTARMPGRRLCPHGVQHLPLAP
jgi:response regulator RpfG family c-di-GMP phosphodiesterase